MDNSGSVTRWIRTLQRGDPEAATQLWERYFRRLAAVARAQMGQGRRTGGDEEDVALSAFHSFFRCVREGRFATLQGRDELWRVLVVIAKRKAINWLRHETADIRGGGKVQGDAFLSDVVSPEPTPQFTAELLDEFRHVLEILRNEDGTLCLIALRKLEGYTSKEIAAELSLSVRTVERKSKRICVVWAADADQRAQGDPT